MLEALPLQGPGATFFVIPLIALLVLLALVVWTYNDAQTNSDHPAFLWAVVVLLAPLLGIVLYLVIGRN